MPVWYQAMVFKMLILLGFFADTARSFIHSDIHRRFVDRLDYPMHKLWFWARRSARFAGLLSAKCGEMRAPNRVISTDWNWSLPFVFIWLRRFLIAEVPIRNGVIWEW
jgi:hypothetical protein